ncbi:MAG: hypothetical protein RLY74_837 [Actinomycetota bacterium]|jgi:hypothetical protein
MKHFKFEGDEIPFNEGESIAAALLRAGIWQFRESRKSQQPRSLFCGIGHCYDCMVVINENINQRACLLEAREGLSIKRQRGVN